MNMDWFGYVPEKLRNKNLLLLVSIAGALVVIYSFSGGSKTDSSGGAKDQTSGIESRSSGILVDPSKQASHPQLWTCSMHPQIKLPKPGKCPICFMDLIPLESGHEDSTVKSALYYSMSEQAKRLAEVETTEVKRQRARIEVRMLGMVYEDETRVAALTSRVDGRLDEIYVNFTGVQVTKGDPMVKIWSPTLIKNQVELFETLRTGTPDEGVIQGAQEKLIQSGLTADQIAEIREKKKPNLYVTLKAPISGTVMKKLAVLGQFVKEGTEMYIINDLSHVWIKLDAYETDIPWVRYGQNVTFTTPSFPGRKFSGKVLFIDPTLDVKTRSVKVRVEAPNPDLSLKPGMFVTAELQSEIDQSGRIIKPEWAGKYVCPVHPSDVASEVPGNCPDSNIALRPASAFGYVDEKEPTFPLVIPASAPLITGKRALVYVESPERDRPTYEAREVVLGPRAGDHYVVYEGLKEGERVVTRGNFKIDSAMQILSKPSMMKPSQDAKKETAQGQTEEQVIKKVEVPRSFLEELSPIIEEYLSLKDSLVEEDPGNAVNQAKNLKKILESMNVQSLDPRARALWEDLVGRMLNALGPMGATMVVEDQRKSFENLSEAFVRLLMSFRHVMREPLVVFHCPMAFDQEGAYWVQIGEERRNPYFGRKRFKNQDMLTCGELIEKIAPESAPPSQPQNPKSTDQTGAKGSGK